MRSEIPFGWKKRWDGIAPSDLEQWVIKRILDEQQHGKSLEEISRDLKKIGIKPKGGGEWFPRRILKILSDNESLHKTLNREVWTKPAKPPDEVPAKAHVDEIKISTEQLDRPIRPGAILYQIRESMEAVEDSKEEAEHRSQEVGKIVTQALLLTVVSKHLKGQHKEGGANELQNRGLRPGEHGGTGPTEGRID